MKYFQPDYFGGVKTEKNDKNLSSPSVNLTFLLIKSPNTH
jgi:hypothetical protein